MNDNPLWTRADIRTATGGSGGLDGDAEITSVTIDSRQARAGALFVAIAGERFDGHDFVDKAIEAGASEALVHRTDVPGIRCADSFVGLQDLARAAIGRSDALRIAVTGSVGKTGTKELLAVAFDAYATPGNLNNHFGLPVTLANMPAESKTAILELGMNHAGEIRELTALAKPEIAIITAIAAAHSEFFAGEHEIADAKAEIFEGLVGTKQAIIPADSVHSPRLRAAAERYANAVYSFGEGGDAQITELLQLDNGQQTIIADVAGEQVAWNLRLMGKHWARNSLAVALALKLAGQDVQRGMAQLDKVAPIPGRGQLIQLRDGLRVLDEVYNASPSAMAAAIEVTRELPNTGRRVAILGDMLELGETGPAAHSEAIATCAKSNFDLVLGCGPLFGDAIATTEHGSVRCKAFNDSAALLPQLQALIEPGDLVLIKGSLGSKMAIIRDSLIDQRGR